MSYQLVAIIAMAVGLIACFYGYPLVRILFAVVGLIIGYQIGIQLVPTDNWLLAVGIGIVVGLICAALAYPFWSIGIVLSGAVLGYALFSNFAAMFNASPTVNVIVGVVGAVIMAILFLLAIDPMIMFATAFSGASYAVYGLALLIPQLATNSVVMTVAVVVLGALGFLVQYRLFSERRLYARTTTVVEPL
jgi:hypothetical protein